MLGARKFTPKVDKCWVLSREIKEHIIDNYNSRSLQVPEIHVFSRLSKSRNSNININKINNPQYDRETFSLGFALKRFSSRELAKYVNEVTHTFEKKCNLNLFLRFHPNQRMQEIRQIISLLKLHKNTKIYVSCSNEKEFFSKIDCLFLLRGTMVSLASEFDVKAYVYQNINYPNFETKGVINIESEAARDHRKFNCAGNY